MWRFIKRVCRLGRLEPGAYRGKHEAPDDTIIIPHLCDACHMARAVYVAMHWGIVKTLYFCGAHYRKNKTALEEQGWDVREAQ